ncbi:MAG: hypothetical protein ACR2IF_04770 [Terriglobales bacterium]
MKSERKTDVAAEALRFTLGGTAFVAGLDKFFNLLTDWDKYISPIAHENLPVSDRNFMRLVGVIEMGVGALILKGETRLGGYIAGGWLLGIAANLIANRDYDIAARDVNMAVGAFALAQLSEARRAARPVIKRTFEEQRAA